MSRDKKLDRWSSSWLFNERRGPLFPMLEKEDMSLLASCSRSHYNLFQAPLSLWHLLQLVARGQQQEAEVMLIAEVNGMPIKQVEKILQKEIKEAKEKGMIIATFHDTQKKLAQAKERIKEKKPESNPKAPEAKPSSRLLCEKSKFPVMDWAGEETGETFANRTAFQIAVEMLDRHMYRMLLRLRTDASELDEGKLYLKVLAGEIYYSVITLYGESVMDVKISREQWAILEEKSQEKVAIPALRYGSFDQVPH